MPRARGRRRPRRRSPSPVTIRRCSCARSEGAVTNLAELETVALGNGAINSTPDLDQVIRRVPLVLALQGELYPSLAAEALRVAQGAATNVIKSSGASGVLAFGEQTGVSALRIGEFEIPTDPEGRLWLYSSRHEPARYLSAWSVLEDDFDPDAVAGQIVLVGTSAAGLHDIRATPVEPSIPGVEIHAQAIEQILAGAFLHRPDFADGMELAYMLALGLIMIVMLRTLGALVSLLVLGLATVVVLAGSWLAFESHGWLLDPVQPSLMVLLVFVTAEGISYMQSEAERRQVRGAFKQYLAPELVDQLARHPERLRLGGEQRTMTIMFCDVRGFTTISEQYKDDPQGLTALVNRLLTPMTEVVLGCKGTIDKYIGDCIMAFWNAPLEDPEHAAHACRAALGMHAAIRKLNAVLAEEGNASAAALEPPAERARSATPEARRAMLSRLSFGPPTSALPRRSTRSARPTATVSASPPIRRRRRTGSSARPSRAMPRPSATSACATPAAPGSRVIRCAPRCG